MSVRADGRVARASVLRKTRRADILEVALSVFASNGYHQTRVSDIIQAAGIARGTFYLYFESKSAIFFGAPGRATPHSFAPASMAWSSAPMRLPSNGSWAPRSNDPPHGRQQPPARDHHYTRGRGARL